MAARTGEQFLKGLAQDNRQLWFDGELVDDVTTHPQFAGAARSMADLYDAQYRDPEIHLMASPSDGEPVHITHIVPRTKQDLRDRQRAIRAWAELSGGTRGRTPDYLNVTVACFAGRADVLARHDQEDGANNIIAYHALIRDQDLCTTHVLVNPQVDRSVSEDKQAGGDVAMRKIGETQTGIIVHGAKMLATLAPYSDELIVYPGYLLPDGADDYAVSFAIPMDTPGLSFICRDSYARDRDIHDYPLSSRFDEQDAVAIFDNVEIPWGRVFVDADVTAYNAMQIEANWRAHIIHQAMTRANTKLDFAFGLAHMIAQTTGVATFGHVQEKLGEIWHYAEMTRSGLVAAVEGAELDAGGIMTPDERSFVALRGLMPKWSTRATELIQLIGGGGFMATPTAKDMKGPMRPLIDQYYQARGADADKRIRLFRLAWDFVGSELAGRNELYERFYLGDSFRMTSLAYELAPKEQPETLVERFLTEME
jgi:4-hydroxyphenylacetate 3-monooxygenase oxygenase component